MARSRRASLFGRSALAAAAAVVVTAGCSSGGGSGTQDGPSAGPGTTASAPAPTTPSTSGGPRTLSLSFADNGTSVHLASGGRLHIALTTPFWTFRPPNPPGVLRQDATGVATPTATCPGPAGPAGGCRLRTADYTAVGAGRTTLVATRAVCGEAMRCTGGTGRFTVSVTVD